MKLRIALKYKLLIPFVCVVGGLLLYPLGYAAWISFYDYNIGLGKSFVRFDNYTALTQNFNFVSCLRVTFIFLSAAVVLQFLVGFSIAQLINRVKSGRNFFRTLLLTPMFCAPVAVGLLARFMLHSELGVIPFLFKQLPFFGLGNIEWLSSPKYALLSIILVQLWQGAPFAMILLLAGLESLPQDPYEAAQIDGASVFVRFWYITVPLMKHIIAITILIIILDTIKMFEYSYVITEGGPGNTTEILSLFIYREAFRNFRMGSASAMAWVLLLIMLGLILTIFFAIVRRKEL